MDRRLARCAAALLFAALFFGIPAQPALACTVGTPFAAGKPFSDTYFDAGHTIFRGKPMRYRLLKFPTEITSIIPEEFRGEAREYAAEITFAISDTLRGEARDPWVAVWENSTFGLPRDLNAFRDEIGDDLVIVLRDPGDKFDSLQPIYRQTSLPMIAQRPCHEPAMQAFDVMEPVLRRRGLID